MVIKREVAYGIVTGLSTFLKCEELQDFVVTLGTTKFGCHRFLLAACSGFFRALFRSGMKETESKCVTVEDISSETFELILETLYTGHGVLTNDNVIDIWRAAHQLQITFLMTECEEFIIRSLSLENYFDYYQTGKLLSSQPVTKAAWWFMLKNFNSFVKTDAFLELSISELLNLVRSQKLVVDSENDVMMAILKWTDYRPNVPLNDLSEIRKLRCKRFQAAIANANENNLAGNTTIANLTPSDINLQNPYSEKRDQNLGILLSNTRSCLVSPECLEKLLYNPLVSDNKMARDVVTNALLYTLQIGKRNGQWPTAAIHRKSSAFQNVALSTKPTENGGLKLLAYSFSRNKWLNLNTEEFKRTDFVAFCTVDNALYYLLMTQHQDQEGPGSVLVFKLIEKAWSETKISLKLNYARFSAAVINEFIYIMQSKGKNMWRLHPITGSLLRLDDLPDDQPICHVTCYNQCILLFHSVTKEGVDETVVQCYNTAQNIWTRLNNLEGPANGMTSFKDDHFTYILQSSGDIWKMVKPQSDVLDFEYAGKLWGCD
ncbi:kelch-like protein 28 [Biomphalaria glabrata]|uniref:Kelch-like protein 10 isoform X2 n=1 Tax=Biomphalaria glabrata TaxID=6526 RepID=A0A9W2Z1T6_BIOGL|nr:kelch-like protein 10 isoform X2 [Biomphalaria glabrata]KAI8751618.1 kelch-like protein 28 [Biomphalaria glabrata]